MSNALRDFAMLTLHLRPGLILKGIVSIIEHVLSGYTLLHLITDRLQDNKAWTKNTLMWS